MGRQEKRDGHEGLLKGIAAGLGYEAQVVVLRDKEVKSLQK